MDPTFYRVAQSSNCQGIENFSANFYTQRTANGNTILHVLAESIHSSANAVKQILARKPDLISKKNKNGETPLIVASRAGHLEVVRALIDHAKAFGRLSTMFWAVDKDGNTALHEDVRFNWYDVVKLLVDEQPADTDGNSAVDGLVLKLVVKQLPRFDREKFAGESPLYVAVEKGYHQIATLILSTGKSISCGGPQGRTVLHAAALRNSSDCMELILAKLPNIIKLADAYGWTALHYAAKLNHKEMVKLILSANKFVGYLAPKTNGSRTALHIAVIHGHLDVIREILIHCPDCWEMITLKGQSILHLAVQHEQKEVLDFILENSWASQLINRKDVEGNTPLHLYVATNNLVGYNLVNHPGVDRNAFNNKDMTPLDTITLKADEGKERQRWSIRDELTRAGATPGLRTVTTRLNKASKTKLDKTSETGQEKSDTYMVVAALIVTVSFAAGFTIPGGYDTTKGNEGMAVLSKKAAFIAFVVSDSVALVSSALAVLYQFAFASKILAFKRPHEKDSFLASIAFLISIALTALVIAFLTGLYAVVPSEDIKTYLIIIGAALCSPFPVYLLVLLARAAVSQYKAAAENSYAASPISVSSRTLAEFEREEIFDSIV